MPHDLMAGTMMQHVTLGRTGLQTSWLGLGTAPIGSLFAPVTPQQAHAVVERAWAHGIRLFDTAPLYGFGMAEQRLGTVLAGKPREAFVLTTKVGRLLRTEGVPDLSNYVDGEPIFKDAPDLRPVFDFSRAGVQASLAESRHRLGLERIDIAYLHDPDNHFEQASGTGLAALQAERAAGALAGLGAGMNQTAMLTRFVRETDVDVVLVAGRYSLLDRSAQDELLPLCAQRGVAVVVGGVFNSGILAQPHGNATYNYVTAPDAMVRRALRLQSICADHGVPLRAAALQFARRHTAVTAVLVGARSVQEVDDAVAMAAITIPPALWRDLDAEYMDFTGEGATRGTPDTRE